MLYVLIVDANGNELARAEMSYCPSWGDTIYLANDYNRYVIKHVTHWLWSSKTHTIQLTVEKLPIDSS